MNSWLKCSLMASLVLAAIGIFIAVTGVVPLKASSGHWAITRWFLQFSKDRSIALYSLGVSQPALEDPGIVLKGAGHYEFGCRSCHGAPGDAIPRIAQGMLPRPPPLGPVVEESTPKRLFHIVKHGLKFTGMPAWPALQRDDEVWAMVAFLLRYPDLDQAGYARLVSGEPPPPSIEQLAPTAGPPQSPVIVNQLCIRCHGTDGLGRDSTVFPKLAGQRREYLENSLQAYARGTRPSGLMGPVAAGLKDDVIRALAGYYAQLPREEPRPKEEHDSALLALGRTIAHEGVPKDRIPACVECHSPTGHRTKPSYPLLAGQPADYLKLQLELFKKGERGGSPNAHLMQHVAPYLSEEQMRAVALYFESEYIR